jgi:hypothetical protein
MGVTPWYEAALWGFLGGAILDGIDFAEAIRRNAGRFPAKYKRVGHWVGEAIRLAAGAALAVALNRAGYTSGVLGSFVAGVAAPAIIRRLSQELPRFPEK